MSEGGGPKLPAFTGETMKQYGESTHALFRIADLASGELDALPVHEVLLHNVAQLTLHDAALTLEKHDNALVIAATSGGAKGDRAVGRRLPAECVDHLTAVLQRGRLATFGEDSTHPCSIEQVFGWRPTSSAIVPIRVGGSALGGLVLARKSGPPFGWEDEKVLVPLTAVVGRLLQSVKLLADMREHSRHLAEEHKRVVEAHRLQRDFISNVSHELRTPLTGILGFAELLQDDDVGSDSESRNEFLGMISESGNDLLSLINKILDFGKLKAGRREPTYDQVDVARIAQHVVESLQARATQKSLAVDVWHEPAMPQAWASAQFCEEIVTNLVGNAIKFTAQGWVRVLIRGVTARIGQEDTAEAVEIRVVDSGPGIPYEQQQTIFEPFRQVDGSHRRHHGGTGLGLALCREMVEAVDGRIWVESRPGEGSTFVVLLPAVTGEERRSLTYTEPVLRSPSDVSNVLPARTPLPWGQQDEPRVLLAFDDSDEAERIKQALCEAGYRVKLVAGGSEILSATNRLVPDAILMDLHLTDMNAWQVLGSLRANAATRATAVVMASPFSTHAGQPFFDGHGHCVEMPTPLDDEGLLAWLSGLLETRQEAPPVLFVVGFGGEFLTALDREAGSGEVAAVRCNTAADAARELARATPRLIAWRPSDTDPTAQVLATALEDLGDKAPPVALVAGVVPPGLQEVCSLPGTGIWPPARATAVALIREVSRLSHHRPLPHVMSSDPLTGLPGRAYMERRLNEEQRRAARYGRPFSALTFVIEDVADGRGVPVAVQRAAATALRRELRECDIVARAAPGTFVVLLPETAPEMAEAARRRLAKLFPTGHIVGHPYHSFSWPRPGMEPTAQATLDDLLMPPG